MTKIRGPRRSSLACNIAHLCGWARLRERDFGGLSPSRQLFLGRVEDDESARQIVDVLWNPFGGPASKAVPRCSREEFGWYKLNLRFGRVPEHSFCATASSQIELFLDRLKTHEPRDQVSAVHRFVLLEL